jgi:hypothetical protein
MEFGAVCLKVQQNNTDHSDDDELHNIKHLVSTFRRLPRNTLKLATTPRGDILLDLFTRAAYSIVPHKQIVLEDENTRLVRNVAVREKLGKCHTVAIYEREGCSHRFGTFFSLAKAIVKETTK